MKQGSKHKVIQSGVLVDCMSGGCPFHESLAGKNQQEPEIPERPDSQIVNYRSCL